MNIYEHLRTSTNIYENLRKSMKIYENRWKVYKNIYKKINKGKFIKRLIKGGENKGGAAAFGRRPSFTLKTLY